MTGKKIGMRLLAGAALLCVMALAGCAYGDTDGDSARILPGANGEYEDFADDMVIVVLTNEVSLSNIDKIYTTEDFPEFAFSSVEESTELLLPLVKAQIEAEKTGVWPPWLDERRKYGAIVNLDVFKRILCLRLTNKSIENVLRACELLGKRDDIEYAHPDTFETMDKIHS